MYIYYIYIFKSYTAYVDILSTCYFGLYSLQKTHLTSLCMLHISAWNQNDWIGFVGHLGSNAPCIPCTWLAVLRILGSTLSKTNMESENYDVQNGSSMHLFKGCIVYGFHLCIHNLKKSRSFLQFVNWPVIPPVRRWSLHLWPNGSTHLMDSGSNLF